MGKRMILVDSVGHQHQWMLLEQHVKLPPLLQSIQSLFVFVFVTFFLKGVLHTTSTIFQ